jgi:MFS family permease
MAGVHSAPSEHSPLLPSDSSALSQSEDSLANGANGSTAGPDALPRDESALSTARIVLIMSGVYVSAFLSALDSTLVATLASPIATSFSSLPLLSWLASAYFIANGVSQPLAGRLTDIYGRRSGMLFANVVFGVGNIICALAQSESAVIAGRVVAGIGGGVIGPTATAFASDFIPLRKRGLWQGIANLVFGIGSGIGGPLGGLIEDQLGWRWAFWVQMPLTAIAILLVLIFMNIPGQELKRRGDNQDRQSDRDDNRGKVSKWKQIDFLGAFLLVATMIAFLTAFNTAGVLVLWKSPIILISLLFSLVLLLTFFLVERRHPKPIIPVALLLNHTVLAACLTNWFVTMARFGVLFFAPLYFLILGYSVAASGLRFVPESIAIGIASVGAGLIMNRTGRYYLLNTSLGIIFVIGLALTATFSIDTPAWLPFVALFCVGAGYAGLVSTTLLASIAAIEHQHQAVITSASYAFRSTGSMIGIAVANTVFQARLGIELDKRIGGRKGTAEVVWKVRNSIQAIRDLPEEWKGDVILAYVASLRVVFAVLLGLGASGTMVSLFMREHKLYRTMARKDDHDGREE